MNLSKQKRTLLIIWSCSLFIAIVILGSYLVMQQIFLEDFMGNIDKIGMIGVTYLVAIVFLQFFVGNQTGIRDTIDRHSL